MVLFNYSTKELTAKVVYYGAGLCGKTTNLQWIHEKLPIKNKGKMVSLATEADRTLFFDFLPIELGTIRGMKTRVQLYTVPGQVFYNATRRMVLKGADCVVFVADSQEPMLDANLDALANLRENLEANEIDADQIPTVMQYNKRDLPNALPVSVLNERLNPRGWLHFEASAKQGVGVEETLKGVTGLVFRSLAAKYGGVEGGAAKAPPKPAPRPAALAPPPPPPRPPAPAPPAPVPRRGATPLAGGSADELLDSLELGAPEPDEITQPGVEDLGMDAPFARRGPDTAPDLTPFEEPAFAEELDLEDLGVEPEPIAPPPARGPATQPPMPAAAPPRAPVVPPRPSPAPPPPPAAPYARPAPVAAPQADIPVSVQVSGAPGATEVVIPVEIALAEGTTKVTLNLRLTLNLKLPR
jgi:signal recognition particle receptor subunit beta